MGEKNWIFRSRKWFSVSWIILYCLCITYHASTLWSVITSTKYTRSLIQWYPVMPTLQLRLT